MANSGKKKRAPTSGAFKKNNRAAAEPSYDREERLSRNMNRSTLTRILNNYIWSNRTELRAFINDPNLSGVERGICLLLLDHADHGRLGTLEYFLSRLVGKVADKLEIEKTDPYASMSIDEIRAEQKRLAEINRETFKHILEKDEKLKALEIEYRDVTSKPT